MVLYRYHIIVERDESLLKTVKYALIISPILNKQNNSNIHRNRTYYDCKRQEN